MTPVKFARLLFLPALFVFLSGCPFSPGKSTKPPVVSSDFLDPISPENVLKNLITAYQQRKLDEYAKLFDQDEFFFEFSQLDRDSDPSLPLGLNYTEDQATTRNMFDDETLERIVLRFNRDAAVDATDLDQLPGGPAGVKKVIAQSVHLEVHTQNENGEPLEYLVDGDGADFFFRSYNVNRADGKPIYRIVRWRDKPVGGLFTVGQLKHGTAS